MADNPVRAFLGEKTKEAAARAEDDLKLWHAWQQGGREPELLQPLIKRYDPLLNRKVQEWKAPAVSPSAFRAELQKHFIGAAQTFDPERGVAFNTHLQTRLRQAQRFNLKHQNVGYIPEAQAAKIGPLQHAQNELNEQLGRDPTNAELSSHLGMPETRVNALLKSMRKDVPSSKFETDPASFATSRENDVIRLMQKRPHDYLKPDEVKVFNHIFGTNGAAKVTDTTTIASRLNLSQPKVSRLKTSIADKIKKNM